MATTGSGRRRAYVAWATGAVVALAVVAGIVWLVLWSLRGAARVDSQTIEGQRSAWESAMAKASVEATFPGGPVDLEQVRATGAHPFSATFTAEEIDALLAIYRYTRRRQGRDVSLDRASVLLPEPGRAAIRGRIVIDGSSYTAKASGPVRWADGVVVDASSATVSVEGFELTGDRKAAALDAIEGYLDGLLAAAPGLVVREATVTSDGLSVRGTAPARLAHPEPSQR